MDSIRFDRLTRSLSLVLSRRGLASALGLGALAFPHAAGAKKKRKRKKKITRNAFGCVDVGGFCKNSGQCCSGICQGKQGKKRCQAHDTGGCAAGQVQGACDGGSVACTTTAGLDGFCETTTGNAGFCSRDADCFACTKDADCVPFCGPAAACVRCAIGCPVEGTACASPDNCTIV